MTQQTNCCRRRMKTPGSLHTSGQIWHRWFCDDSNFAVVSEQYLGIHFVNTCVIISLFLKEQLKRFSLVNFFALVFLSGAHQRFVRD